MAMSNWDLLAFDTKGQPGDGILALPDGRRVEIYKNWLHVHDPKAWYKEGAHYNQPIVAKIESGVVDLCGMKILAARCNQDGIMCYVEADGEIMAGVGCYAFVEEGPEQSDGQAAYPEHVGVLPGTLAQFWTWLASYEYEVDEEWLAKAKAAQPLRFNQGDAYFSTHGVAAPPPTAVGQVHEPLITHMLQRGEA